MAKNWYPVIDYSKCVACGNCIQKCTHKVYKKEKFPLPVVVFSDGCIDHCHGCGNLCPTGAISYVGDDTGWLPPNREKRAEPCCVGDFEEHYEDKLVIDFLYLDTNVCERCSDTEESIDQAIQLLTPVFDALHATIVFNKLHITSKELAQKYRLESSPTIRANGIDILGTVSENYCAECSELSGKDTTCRVFHWNGEVLSYPSCAMLVSGILAAVFGDKKKDTKPYSMPANISDFFGGCNCGCSGSDCCK